MTTWTTRAACAVGALVLSGCDLGKRPVTLEDQPAAEIFAQAEAAMKSLDSFSVTGVGVLDGESLTFESSVSRDGDCQATLRLGLQQAELRTRAGERYIRGNDSFWGEETDGAGPTLAELKDRWVAAPPRRRGDDDYFNICRWQHFRDVVATFGDEVEDGAEYETVEGRNNTGRPSIELVSRDGGTTIRVWVATDGDPVVLRFSEKTFGVTESVFFRDFDEPVDVELPPASEVLDYTDLDADAT